jgi:hypothetical protein
MIITDQREVDSILRWGIVFSVLWLGGIGSLVAVRAGLRARRLIAASDGTLTGSGGAWWCVVVGGVGAVVWLPILGIGILNNLAH